MDDRIAYLNDVIEDKAKSYKGPGTLFKYRPFDRHAFDMIENAYLYLCPACDLDDKSECDATIDLDRLIDLESNNLKRECVSQIIDYMKPYCSEDTFEMVRNKILTITNPNGTVRPNFMLDIYPELQEMVPNYDIAPMVNWIVGIPKKLDDPEIKPQIEKLILMALNAKKEIGLCSLTDSAYIKPMWDNYYTDYGNGYCIEYDVSSYELNNAIFPVVYDDNRQTNVIMQIVANFIGQMITGFSNGEIKADKSQFVRLFLSKNVEWKYQNEWRLIGKAAEKPKAPKIMNVYLGKNVSEENESKMIRLGEDIGFGVYKMKQQLENDEITYQRIK